MITTGAQTPRIDVILGRCDDMRAEVYVRATSLPANASAAVITGSLAGPESRLAITLPTITQLVDLGPGPDGAAVARAILTEPGYWTPELPHRYRLTAEVRADGRTLASCDRLVGLRRLGVRGRSFWLEGRRWVPRGIACGENDVDPAVFRQRLATAVIDDPTERMCDVGDEAGVAIIARCGGDPVADCTRWSMHPSVMLMVLPPGLGASGVEAVARKIAPVSGTMLLGLEADGRKPSLPTPRGIDCLVMSLPAGAMPDDSWRDPPPVPVLASRASPGERENARSACDKLQADLAAWRGAKTASWDWAGFLAAVSG